MNPQNIPTWSETNEVAETSKKSPALKYARWVAMTITACSTALLAACTQQAQAQDSKTEVVKTAQLSQTVQPKVINASVSPSESNEKIASLDEILEAGKLEWMENTKAEYWEEAAEIWDETVEELSVKWKETMSKFVVKDLQEFTPNMLLQFADLDKNIYPKLVSMWEVADSWKRAEESWKRAEESWKRAEDSWKRAEESCDLAASLWKPCDSDT